GQDEPLWGLVAVDREGQRDVRGQGLSGAGDVLGLHAVEGAVDRRQTVDGPALVVLVVEGPRVREGEVDAGPGPALVGPAELGVVGEHRDRTRLELAAVPAESPRRGLVGLEAAGSPRTAHLVGGGALVLVEWRSGAGVDLAAPRGEDLGQAVIGDLDGDVGEVHRLVAREEGRGPAVGYDAPNLAVLHELDLLVTGDERDVHLGLVLVGRDTGERGLVRPDRRSGAEAPRHRQQSLPVVGAHRPVGV